VKGESRRSSVNPLMGGDHWTTNVLKFEEIFWLDKIRLWEQQHTYLPGLGRLLGLAKISHRQANGGAGVLGTADRERGGDQVTFHLAPEKGGQVTSGMGMG